MNSHLPIIFMFSGQGSQYYQMGHDLFEKNKTFTDWMFEADRYCQKLIGLSIIEQLYNKDISKSHPFIKTLLTHPAIFMVEHALMQVLLEQDIRPDFVLGTSLGEFTAAVAADVLSWESAFQAIISQAQALERCEEGAMLAILENQELYQEQTFLNQQSELAAINFPMHFVIAGRPDNLKQITQWLNEKNIASQLLPTSQAFHSSLIDSAKPYFLETMKSMEIQKPNIPFISCLEAKFITSLSYNHFWDIIRFPIHFQDTIHYLENQQNALYLDVGPSGTLATFVKYNLLPTSKSKQFSILTPYGEDVKNLEYIKNVIAI